MEFEQRLKIDKYLRMGLFFSISAFLIFATPIITGAATLNFNPSSGDFTVGNIFTVSVLVNTQGKAINSAEAILNFPTDFLEVVSISKSASIFSLWVEEPSFSNNAGTIFLTGGLPTPGFNGSAGNIISIVFRAKRAGSVSLIFSSAAVRANDGEGTNILTSSGNAQFSLGYTGPSVPEATTPVVTAGVPAAPQISSLTHPDPNKWYTIKDAKFAWTLPTDATAVRLLANKIPQAVPTVTYSPAVNSKEVTDLEDGIWYFHARLQNSFGWGGISHFRFQIDTQPPKPFLIKFVDGKETDNPRPLALFEATDSLSGIDHYSVKIGEGDFFETTPEIIKHNPYTLPLQHPGKRTILVQAYDKASNYTTASEEFVILSISPPKITEYPAELKSGEILIIKGESYPDSEVTVYLAKEKEEPKRNVVRTDKEGKFIFVADEKLGDGIYKVWAEAIDECGAVSYPTQPLIIVVKVPPFLQFIRSLTDYLSATTLLVAVLLLFGILLLYGWRKIYSLRKKIKKEVREAEQALHKSFDLLKEDIREQIKMLEKARTKRQLTGEEEKIVKQLKKDLDDAEKFVRKEIEDIEKEIK